jgi:hypothetical protein
MKQAETTEWTEAEQATIAHAMPGAPSPKSPVGMLMVKIREKYPELDFEAARAKSHNLLAIAARAKNYRQPTVYSEAELVARAERFKLAFGRGKKAA